MIVTAIAIVIVAIALCRCVCIGAVLERGGAFDWWHGNE